MLLVCVQSHASPFWEGVVYHPHANPFLERLECNPHARPFSKGFACNPLGVVQNCRASSFSVGLTCNKVPWKWVAFGKREIEFYCTNHNAAKFSAPITIDLLNLFLFRCDGSHRWLWAVTNDFMHILFSWYIYQNMTHKPSCKLSVLIIYFPHMCDGTWQGFYILELDTRCEKIILTWKLIQIQLKQRNRIASWYTQHNTFFFFWKQSQVQIYTFFQE